MSERPTPADFLTFCVQAFGTSPTRPLIIEKLDKIDTVNGATIAALFEVWKYCNTPAPQDKPAPRAANESADPLGLLPPRVQ